VKRLTAWLAGAAGGLAAYRALKKKRPQAEPDADARAAELKAKLDEARAVAEVAVDEAEPLDPQARRAQVHEQGRAALDEMRGEDTL
jgi:hypothetical protein